MYKTLIHKFAKVVLPKIFILLSLFLSAAYIVNILSFRENTQLLKNKNDHLSTQLSQLTQEITSLKNVDQFIRNKLLEEEIVNIQKTYTRAVATYENLIKLKEQSPKVSTFDSLFTDALTELAKRQYASAEATLMALNKKIEDEKIKQEAAFKIPESITQSNTPPSSGYSRQKVSTDQGEFLVDLVSADLGSTKVLVDTASENTCTNDCPTLSLATYVSKNGAFAGVNGSYFCPAEYPSCEGKKNSFDTLLMNKNKTYFNSDNNIYSTVPAVIFGNGWVRFVGASQEWGRDTSIDSMIANQPLLVAGSNVVFGGDGDPKKGNKGGRSFVANKGNTVYIGVVFNATVAESAHALKALGMENALNLDSGGSTALWTGGYKVGPGRNIPNAILFVRK